MDYLQGQNIWLLLLSLFWALPWKGFALWQAAKLNHKRWFIVILVVNLMGVLEILYLLFYNKTKEKKETWLTKVVKKKLNMV